MNLKGVIPQDSLGVLGHELHTIYTKRRLRTDQVPLGVRLPLKVTML